ncbi:hypothetical protein LCGC14_2415700, partial [marine sediment metagenome]
KVLIKEFGYLTAHLRTYVQINKKMEKSLKGTD